MNNPCHIDREDEERIVERWRKENNWRKRYGDKKSGRAAEEGSVMGDKFLQGKRDKEECEFMRRRKKGAICIKVII